MQLASVRLAAGASVQAVASEVGYTSEAAFSRAFKKVVGAAPAGWAVAQRGGRTAGEAPRAHSA
jgi:AraC-like DNA-binding protein